MTSCCQASRLPPLLAGSLVLLIPLQNSPLLSSLRVNPSSYSVCFSAEPDLGTHGPLILMKCLFSHVVLYVPTN